MSKVAEVNRGTQPSPFIPQYRRVLGVLALGFLAVLLLSPLAHLAGLGMRKSAVSILRFTVILAFAWTARTRFREETGLFGCSRPLRIWWRGFFTGAGTLGAWIVILTLLGERSFVGRPWLDFAWQFSKYIPLAFLIGFLEDLLFFGFLYAALGRQAWPCALIYAVSHFLAPDRHFDFGDQAWLAGWQAWRGMAESLVEGFMRPVELIGLFLVGWSLIALRRESASLWLAMGVHGGWYWARSVSRKLGEDLEGNREWLFGSDRFYDGVLGWVAIVLTALILLVTRRRRALLQGEEED